MARPESNSRTPDMDSVAYRFSDIAIEKRADGEEVITGVVVPYNVVADLGFFKERMLPGSLRFDDVIANVMHDRSKPIARTGAGLELVNGNTELRGDHPSGQGARWRGSVRACSHSRIPGTVRRVSR